MGQTIFADWRERVKYREERPDPQIISDDGIVRVILGGLCTGQMIPIHPEAKAVYHFLDGEGVMTVNEARIPVSQGMTVVVSEGDKRGIQAQTALAFLAVRISPDADSA